MFIILIIHLSYAFRHFSNSSIAEVMTPRSCLASSSPLCSELIRFLLREIKSQKSFRIFCSLLSLYSLYVRARSKSLCGGLNVGGGAICLLEGWFAGPRRSRSGGLVVGLIKALSLGLVGGRANGAGSLSTGYAGDLCVSCGSVNQMARRRENP